MLRELTLTTIREARRRIAPFVLRTPVLQRRLGTDCELLLKAESLQATGAFKLRGAFNRMLLLPKSCAGRGRALLGQSRAGRRARGAHPAAARGDRDAERCAGA